MTVKHICEPVQIHTVTVVAAVGAARLNLVIRKGAAFNIYSAKLRRVYKVKVNVRSHYEAFLSGSVAWFMDLTDSGAFFTILKNTVWQVRADISK